MDGFAVTDSWLPVYGQAVEAGRQPEGVGANGRKRGRGRRSWPKRQGEERGKGAGGSSSATLLPAPWTDGWQQQGAADGPDGRQHEGCDEDEPRA